MSETKHSPTPWDVSREHGDCHVRDAEGTSLMCDMQYYPWAPSEEDMGFIVEAVNNHERLTQRVQELEEALRIARTKMSHSYNCVKVNPTETWHKDGSVTVGACICEIATVDAALAGTEERP